MQWRDFVTDAELVALIDRALRHNRDIKVAAGRIAEARALYRIQQSPLLPEFDATANGTRSRTPADISVTRTAMTASQFQSHLRAGWEIDLWGKYDSLRDAARDRFLATAEARNAVVTAVVVDVASRYLLEREFAERLALAAESLTTRERALHIMTRRFEVGSGSRLEVTQAATLLAQARTAYAALVQERDINRNALALLAGQPVEIAPAPLSEPNLSTILVGAPSELLLHRPDLRAAELQLSAADADIRAARAAFFPSILLTGAFGTASSQLEGLFRGGSASWNFTPSISMPLFDGGRTRAHHDLAVARRVTAIAEYERSVQRAFRDVSDILVSRRQLASQISGMQTMQEQAQERTRLAERRYETGRSAYLEVLDAQRDLFDTGQRLVQLRRAHLASGIALYAALGGAFAGEQPAIPNPREKLAP